MNKVTTKHVRVTTVAMETLEVCVCLSVSVCVCVCVCDLSYPDPNVYAPYYMVTCGLSGFTIIFILSHKRKNFRKEIC
jgi:hypothetical protein